MVLRKHRAPVGAAAAAEQDAAAPTRSRRLAVAVSGVAAAACLAAPLAGTATAAPAPAHATSSTSASSTTQAAGINSTAATSGVTASAQLSFNELVQSQDQWCWVATGLSIARYLGRGQDTSQNTFCTYARGLPTTSPCPNRPGYLSDVQRSWSRLGMDPGRTTGTLPFQTVQQTIDANSPVEVGIYWTSGGGHARVLYGYDASRRTLMYADPWPSSARYGEMNYQSFVSNGQFRWAESLYGEK